MVLQLGQSGDGFSVAFTPDGQGLITADGDALRYWDNRTHDMVHLWRHNRYGAFSATLSPDGKLIVSIGSNGPKNTTFVYRDPLTGKVVRTLECAGQFQQFTFSPDGKRIAVGGYECDAALLDATTGRRLHTFESGGGSLSALTFTSDSRTLCIGFERGEGVGENGEGWIIGGSVSLIDTNSGKIRRTFNHARTGALSPDGRNLLVAGDQLTLWDTRTWRVLHKLRPREGEPSTSVAAFSPDGRWIAAGGGSEEGGRVVLRDGRTLRKIYEFDTGWVQNLAFSPRSDRLAVAASHLAAELTLWDVRTGKNLRSSAWDDDPLNGIELHPDGRTLAVVNGWHLPAGGGSTTQGRVAFWDLEAGRLVRRLRPSDHEGHQTSLEAIQQVRFSGDGRLMALATGHQANSYSLWSYPDFRLVRTWNGDLAFRERMILSPDAQTMVSWADARVGPEPKPLTKIWSATTGKLRHKLPGASLLAVSPGGKHLLTGWGREPLRLWEVSSGKVARTLKHSGAAVTSGAYTRDGGRLALGHQDGRVTVWDTSGYRVIRTLSGAHLGEVSGLAFSPDGRWLASAALTIKIWDLETGKVAATLRGAAGGIQDLIFARDGAQVVAATGDRALLVWDRASGQLRVTLREFPSIGENDDAREWIACTPEGYYSGSPKAERFIRWRKDGKLLPASAFAAEYRDPARVKAALGGGG